ncbi:2Fe-2S iron-sulfur cluster-binding protein [Streptomyces racemochromogenes]|uniref:2Fe-2S iron-sulfur cluster-binding protein n=1 Tax=Streptomyces racemochromogenes TaxID=67353 RepID=A0ABW7PMB5_9ACTN
MGLAGHAEPVQFAEPAEFVERAEPVGFAEQRHVHYADPHTGTDPGATAEWQFPDALHRDEEASATGHWTLPADFTGGGAGAEAGGVGGGVGGAEAGPDGHGLGLGTGAGHGGEPAGGTGEFRVGGPDGGWGQAPATLPGGARAPWAAPETPAGPGAEALAAAAETPLSSGVLPGGDAAGAHGAGAGPLGRGPRVLGGPGVGTPLPEGYPQAGPEPETALEAAPDIEASHGHGTAQPPAGDERPRPAEAEGVSSDAAPEEQPSSAAAPVPGGADGHGFAEAPAAPAGAEAAPAPSEDTADSAVPAPAGHDTGEFPLGEASYEEERHPAVAHHEHPSASYVLRVNGADRPVTGAWIGESLLYVLRERLGLAGAKDGCSQGECGACAVQVDGRLVASCLVPAATAAGSEVRTVEGLAQGGELSDVQQALCRSGGVQCGFCVPGMAMTIHDLLEGNHAPSDLETRQALCGNLCRCSGYKGVIEAVREVIAEREATAAQATESPAEPLAEPPAEPLIPHQAQPGEGGVHGFDTPFGGHGFEVAAPGPNGTLGGNGFDASGVFEAAAGPDGTFGGNGFDASGVFEAAAPGPNGTLGGNGFDASGAAGGFDAFGTLDATGLTGPTGVPGAAAPGPHAFDGTHEGPYDGAHDGAHDGPYDGAHGVGFDGIHHNGGMA